MGFKADNIDPLRVFEGITITLDPDTGEGIVPVSYTHLTLPTILLV